MLTRKSGILALVLGAFVLGACEQKAPEVTVNVPTTTNPVTVTVSPNPVPALKKGQTVQLVAAVANATGNNQSVTWASSNTAVATVSSAGLVTAVNPGVASVTATSAADASAKMSVAIQVSDTAGTGGGSTTGNPQVSITSVTVNGPNGLNQPVNPGAVAGTIDVTITYDVPAGSNISAVRATLDGNEVCRQSFATGSSADAAIESVPQQFVCTINTAQLGTNGVARFLNGNHVLKAELLSSTGAVAASATYQTLTFANADNIAVNVTTSKAPVLGPGGFAWRGGDVTVTLTPAIYTGTANALSSISVALTPSANAAIQGAPAGTTASSAQDATADYNAGCSTTRTAVAAFGGAPTLAAATCVAPAVTKAVTTFTNNVATVTFSAGTSFAGGGVGNIEDPNLAVTVTGVTTAGNAYAGFATVTNNSVAIAANPLRLDNLAPRVTYFDITPATMGCAPATTCYLTAGNSFTAVNNAAIPASGATAQTIDYGVDLQTTTFSAGTSSTTLTTVTNAGQLPETAVSNTDILAVTTTDALGNARTQFATSNNVCPSNSSTSGSAANRVGNTCQAVASPTIQLFGVDLTPPTMTTAGLANNSTAAAPGATNTLTFTAVDAATPPAGPSGILGIRVKIERIDASGTLCLDPTLTPAALYGAGTSARACGSSATKTMASPATVTLPDASGYYRVTATPVDLAGNFGTPVVRVQLRDFVAPTVGGIACPSSITGGTDVSCAVFASDDLDLGDLLPTVEYTGAGLELEYPRTALGTYGFDVLTTTNSASPNFTIAGFIRSIETTTGAGLPSGAASLASFADVYVRDVAAIQLNNQCVVGFAGPAANASTQNCTRRQDAITTNVQQGIGGLAEPSTFATTGRQFGANTGAGSNANAGGAGSTWIEAAPSKTTVCSDVETAYAATVTAGCATVTDRSTVLTANAVGAALTFANPFTRVLFYAIDPVSGRSFQVCTAPATSVTDNTTVGTRTWTYSCTWTPTVPANAAAYQVYALGVDASGRALKTNNQAVTITAD